ncbi:hypothetical protein BOTBODRAFT_284292 [Botryobasidium botryosum FD-172 SS1]|uniref:Uncharacterized protein n=1 Tax=Botryobasidium botryosum (strain FD-172 SS1) TaxID=930990 RepID=A0A067MJC3_BOTB1|nr:hypothetical protein BOTBODRAFT_284292 [Botryobasidium botryosum FD-172 SS1]
MVILQKQVTETGGASTTAIHRLPTEMLLEILKIYQDCAPKPCPFDIARVCRLWKQVCYDYAPFWSKIDLDLAMRPSSKLDQKVTFWVARAQNALVDVTIRDSARANLRVSGRPIDEADLVSLANVLCGTMSRWRSLEVALLHTHATFFLQKFVGLVPSLRIFELRILCDHNRDESETMHSLYPILFTPHPDTESRTPLAVCLDDSIAIFPSLIGAAITKLSVGATLATAAVDDVLRLLESCPNLEDFYLSGDLPGEPSLGHRVVLSRLTRIRLGPLGYMSSLLSFLELSALQTFEISEVVWDSPLVDALRRIFQLCTSLSTVIMTRNNRWLMGANDAYTPFGALTAPSRDPQHCGCSLRYHTPSRFIIDSAPDTIYR